MPTSWAEECTTYISPLHIFYHNQLPSCLQLISYLFSNFSVNHHHLYFSTTLYTFFFFFNPTRPGTLSKKYRRLVWHSYPGNLLLLTHFPLCSGFSKFLLQYLFCSLAHYDIKLMKPCSSWTYLVTIRWFPEDIIPAFFPIYKL